MLTLKNENKINKINKYLIAYLSIISLFIITNITFFSLDNNFIYDCKSLVVWEIIFLSMNFSLIFYLLNESYFKLKLLLCNIFLCLIVTLMVYITNYKNNYEDKYKFIFNFIRVVFYLYCGLGCYLLLWGMLITACICKSYVA